MPDQPDTNPVPPAISPTPDPQKPDAPPEAAQRAKADHGGFSDTDGESTVLEGTGGG